MDSCTVATRQAAEPVPLRLILPFLTCFDFARCIGFHRSVIDWQGKAHANISSGEPAQFCSTGLKKSPCFSMRFGMQSMRSSQVEIMPVFFPKRSDCNRPKLVPPDVARRGYSEVIDSGCRLAKFDSNALRRVPE